MVPAIVRDIAAAAKANIAGADAGYLEWLPMEGPVIPAAKTWPPGCVSLAKTPKAPQSYSSWHPDSGLRSGG